MSPTTIFQLGDTAGVDVLGVPGAGGGVPGVWDQVGTGRGYTGTHQIPSQTPIFSHI